MNQTKPAFHFRNVLIASVLAAATIFSAGGCELAPELLPGETDDAVGVGGHGGDSSNDGSDDDGISTSSGGKGSGSGGDSSVKPGVCGNGKLQPGELCDDGNDDDGDGCSSDCADVDPNYLCLEEGTKCERVITCGNGVIEGSEKCDDKNTRDDDGCAKDCSAIEEGYSCVKPGEPCVLLPVCGNGQRERGEQCDDGLPPADEDGCDSKCQEEEGFFCPPGEECVPLDCGDGFRTPDEACDDSNGKDDDGCSSACAVEAGWYCSASGCKPVCGDGQKLGTESCDDGNRESGDGCSAACREEPFWVCDEPVLVSVCSSTIACGNGKLEPGEVCDPGIAGQDECFGTGAQACKAFETILPDPVCGNHIVEFGEPCDGDGDAEPNDGGCVNCTLQDGFTCPKADVCIRLPECGDGYLQGDEACDPGAVSAVGCASCIISNNYFCSGEPSVCLQSICGDGFRAPNEQCDDGPGTQQTPGTPVSNDGCSAICKIETGYVCPPGANCQADCGDFIKKGNEECDSQDTTGCQNCRLAPGYDCGVNGDANPCTKAVCGQNGKEAGEGCDDGNLIAGDGCGPKCQVEPVFSGWPDPTVPANQKCGDGIKLDSEGCDDGNKTNGDGCSSSCAKESGWDCSESPTYPDYIDFKVTYRDFKHRNEAGGHPHMKQQAATPPTSTADPGIVGTVCTTAGAGACGRLDSEGKPTYVGMGTHNSIDPANDDTSNGTDSLNAAYHQAAFKLWYRDTNATSVADAVTQANENQPTKTPIQIAPNPGACTPASPGICATAPAQSTTLDTLRLAKTAGVGNPATKASYQFSQASNTFYPLGDSTSNPVKPPRGFGYTNSSTTRNWNWTSELRYYFQYQGGETLTFFGDDDVWVFVNGKLAVDIGGIHGTLYGQVVLGDDGEINEVSSGTDSNCSLNGAATATTPAGCLTTGERDDDEDKRFGLAKGQVYEIVVFQAERHPTGSNYQLTLDGFIAPRSTCNTTCGDNIRAGSEVCDAGPSMPSSGYNTCLYIGPNNPGNCKYQFCGDGIKNGSEKCDNGLNIDAYTSGGSNKCAPGCLDPAYCGDGNLQPGNGEECDHGTAENDGSYGGCTATCKLAPYCGDKAVQESAGETCDPSGGIFDTYGPGKCGYDCKDAPFCGDDVRNGPEICDGDANCNPNCEFDPFCGDGLKTMDEACDYGTFGYAGPPQDAPYDGCTTGCELGPRCGDGSRQSTAGEECDKGTANVDNEYDGCTKDCLNGPTCGDGIPQTTFGETCDNGFNEDEYAYPGTTGACGEGCEGVPNCGDGKVQAAYELCDLGTKNNDNAYNGCTTSCDWGPYCGDSTKNGSEDCDNGPGNVAYSANGKGCSFTCTSNVPYCGDGTRNGPEQCDLGKANNTGAYGKCNANCSLAPYCGDNVVQRDAGEECDEGPSGTLDCSPTCKDRTIYE